MATLRTNESLPHDSLPYADNFDLQQESDTTLPNGSLEIDDILLEFLNEELSKNDIFSIDLKDLYFAGEDLPLDQLVNEAVEGGATDTMNSYLDYHQFPDLRSHQMNILSGPLLEDDDDDFGWNSYFGAKSPTPNVAGESATSSTVDQQALLKPNDSIETKCATDLGVLEKESCIVSSKKEVDPVPMPSSVEVSMGNDSCLTSPQFSSSRQNSIPTTRTEGVMEMQNVMMLEKRDTDEEIDVETVDDDHPINTLRMSSCIPFQAEAIPSTSSGFTGSSNTTIKQRMQRNKAKKRERSKAPLALPKSKATLKQCPSKSSVVVKKENEIGDASVQQSVLEAPDVNSLLEQFEATESISPVPPAPQSQNVITCVSVVNKTQHNVATTNKAMAKRTDASPSAVIKRIKMASSANNRRSSILISPEDAPAQVARSLLKSANSGRAGNRTQRKASSRSVSASSSPCPSPRVQTGDLESSPSSPSSSNPSLFVPCASVETTVVTDSISASTTSLEAFAKDTVTDYDAIIQEHLFGHRNQSYHVSLDHNYCVSFVVPSITCSICEESGMGLANKLPSYLVGLKLGFSRELRPLNSSPPLGDSQGQDQDEEEETKDVEMKEENELPPSPKEVKEEDADANEDVKQEDDPVKSSDNTLEDAGTEVKEVVKESVKDDVSDPVTENQVSELESSTSAAKVDDDEDKILDHPLLDGDISSYITQSPIKSRNGDASDQKIALLREERKRKASLFLEKLRKEQCELIQNSNKSNEVESNHVSTGDRVVNNNQGNLSPASVSSTTSSPVPSRSPSRHRLRSRSRSCSSDRDHYYGRSSMHDSYLRHHWRSSRSPTHSHSSSASNSSYHRSRRSRSRSSYGHGSAWSSRKYSYSRSPSPAYSTRTRRSSFRDRLPHHRGSYWSPSRSRSPSLSSRSSRSRSRSHSFSRSRSRSPYRQKRYMSDRRDWRLYDRSHSPVRSQKMNSYHHQEKARQIEERRVVYVGKIPDGMTRDDLRERFSKFGPIQEVSIHFRDHRDNYGFVTYVYRNDAYRAIEHGNDGCYPHFDLSFGGRRQFCRSRYSDLDSLRDDAPLSQMQQPSARDMDFDSLLRAAQAQLNQRC